MKYNILFTIISLLGFNDAYTQLFKQFDFKGNNLFGLEYIAKDTTKVAIKSLFYDLDADGDQDAIIVGIDKIDSVKNLTFINIHFFIEIQENMGDRWHPSFATRKPFMNNFPFPNGYFFPAIGDLNHDKMPDFIVSSGVDSSFNLQTLYYERKTMTGTNQFNIIGTDSLKLNAFMAGSFMVPDLADMDMDGDLDILMSGFLSEIDSIGKRVEKPTFLYAKNIGTITKPEFLGWYPNPYGLAHALDQDQLSTIGDIDNDNDNDILSLTTYDTFTVLVFLENNHLPNGKPDFTNFRSLLGLPVAGKKEMLNPPSLVDIDGDGDMDVFIVQELKSSENYGIGFYENKLCASNLVNVSRNICSGDSVKIGNQVFKSSGEYYVTIEKVNHCDSTVHLSLIVKPASNQNQEKSICQGEVYTIGSHTYNQTGQYQVKLSSANGCDSIINLNLTVYPTVTTNLTKTGCAGDVFTIGNQTFSQTGLYQVKLSSVNGCDSIINLNLTIHPIITTNLTKSLCTGEVFIVGNQTFTQSGKYEIKLKSSKGCDSIVSATLTFITLDNGVTQSQNSLTANLIGGQYQWFDCISLTDIASATGQSYTPTKNGKYSVKVTDANGCKSVSACYDFVLTGTEIQQISKQITIYPNPTDDYFTIENSSEYTLNRVIIRNNIGQVIKIIKPNLTEKIGTSDLSDGIYSLEITLGQWKVQKNLVIIGSGK